MLGTKKLARRLAAFFIVNSVAGLLLLGSLIIAISVRPINAQSQRHVFAAFAAWTNQAPKPTVTIQAKYRHTHPAPRTPHQSPRAEISDVQRHLADLVATVQPKKGRAYANRVSRLIVRHSRSNHISPYVVAATGVIESEFRMESRPCVGIMQVDLVTASEFRRHYGRDVYDLNDNIWIGAADLSRYYRRTLASRGLSERERLARTWGRYNGCGPRGGYVRRAFLVKHRIEKGNPSTWKKLIKDTGSLWGTHKRKDS